MVVGGALAGGSELAADDEDEENVDGRVCKSACMVLSGGFGIWEEGVDSVVGCWDAVVAVPG